MIVASKFFTLDPPTAPLLDSGVKSLDSLNLATGVSSFTDSTPDSKFALNLSSSTQIPLILCETDYFKRLNLLCHKCSLPLRGPHIKALHHKYHLEHFTCSVCPTVFGVNDTYYERDGQVYCAHHFGLLFASHCGGCGSPVLKNFVEVTRRGSKRRRGDDRGLRDGRGGSVQPTSFPSGLASEVPQTLTSDGLSPESTSQDSSLKTLVIPFVPSISDLPSQDQTSSPLNLESKNLSTIIAPVSFVTSSSTPTDTRDKPVTVNTPPLTDPITSPTLELDIRTMVPSNVLGSSAVDLKKRTECWHPECYMIYKLWNIRLTTSKNLPNSPSLEGQALHSFTAIHTAPSPSLDRNLIPEGRKKTWKEFFWIKKSFFSVTTFFFNTSLSISFLHQCPQFTKRRAVSFKSCQHLRSQALNV